MGDSIPGACDGRAAAPARQLLWGDSHLVADALDQGIERDPGDLRVLRPLDFSPEAFDKLPTAKDPRIPGDGFLCPAQSHQFCPATHAPDEASPLILRSPALGDPSGHERPVGPPRSGHGRSKLRENCRGLLPRPRHDPQEGAVARPGVAVQAPEVGHYPGAEGVQMEVAYQFEQVGFFFHHDGLVPVLEQVPDALVASIECARVSGQERAHAPSEGPGPGAEQQVGVIRQDGPGVDGYGPALYYAREAAEEVGPIGIVPEDGRPLDAPHHDMVQGAGGIQPRSARHAGAQASTSQTGGATLRAFPEESGTPGKAGGLPCAGPSKGPDRTRGPNTPNVCTPFRLAVVFESTTRHIQKNTLPELSNSGSPPAEPGVYLREISGR